MEPVLTQGFIMGFVIATVFYFVVSGLAWIETTPGMDQEQAQAIVDGTNGKLLSEIMSEGLLGAEKTTIVQRDMDPARRAQEMARLSRELIQLCAAENFGAKKTYLH